MVKESAKRGYLLLSFLVGLMFLISLQAAKEFESELKKEPESIGETAVEKPTSVDDEEKQDLKVSNQKESVWSGR